MHKRPIEENRRAKHIKRAPRVIHRRMPQPSGPAYLHNVKEKGRGRRLDERKIDASPSITRGRERGNKDLHTVTEGAGDA